MKTNYLFHTERMFQRIQRMPHRILVICIILLCMSTLTATARIALPYNFYYGEATGVGGSCITGVANARVIAKHNGRNVADTYITGFVTQNVNYILRVPLDDGWETRYAEYATRAGEQIDLFIAYDGIEYPVEDTIEPIGPLATTHLTDIQATPEPHMLCGILFLVTLIYKRLNG